MEKLNAVIMWLGHGAEVARRQTANTLKWVPRTTRNKILKNGFTTHNWLCLPHTTQHTLPLQTVQAKANKNKPPRHIFASFHIISYPFCFTSLTLHPIFILSCFSIKRILSLPDSEHTHALLTLCFPLYPSQSKFNSCLWVFYLSNLQIIDPLCC